MHGSSDVPVDDDGKFFPAIPVDYALRMLLSGNPQFEYFITTIPHRIISKFQENDGWTAIDVSDKDPLKKLGCVEVKHHIPTNKDPVQFVNEFKAIFGNITDKNPIYVIIITDELWNFKIVLERIAPLKHVKVFLIAKENIKGHYFPWERLDEDYIRISSI